MSSALVLIKNSGCEIIVTLVPDPSGIPFKPEVTTVGGEGEQTVVGTSIELFVFVQVSHLLLAVNKGLVSLIHSQVAARIFVNDMHSNSIKHYLTKGCMTLGSSCSLED